MLLVWPKYIFLIKYTLINWNLSTDAKNNFHCVHSYIIFEIQKIRKKTNFTIFQQVWSTTKLCCRLKWAGLWKYHYKPLPIQSLVCSWAVVVPKYRRREFLEFLALAGAAEVSGIRGGGRGRGRARGRGRGIGRGRGRGQCSSTRDEEDSSSSSSSSDEDDTCASCSVSFMKSSGPDWIQCVTCAEWFCGKCNGGSVDPFYECAQCK